MNIVVDVTPNESQYKAQNKSFWAAEEEFCEDSDGCWVREEVSVCEQVSIDDLDLKAIYSKENQEKNILIDVRIELSRQDELADIINRIKKEVRKSGNSIACYIFTGDNIISKLTNEIIEELEAPFVTTSAVFHKIDSDHHFHCWAPMLIENAQLAASNLIKGGVPRCLYVITGDGNDSEAVYNVFKNIFAVIGADANVQKLSFSEILGPCPPHFNFASDSFYVSGYDDAYHKVLDKLPSLSNSQERKAVIWTNAAVCDRNHSDDTIYSYFDFRTSGLNGNKFKTDGKFDKFKFFTYQSLKMISLAINNGKESQETVESELGRIKYLDTGEGVLLMSDTGQLMAPLVRDRLDNKKTVQSRLTEDIAYLLQKVERAIDKMTAGLTEDALDVKDCAPKVISELTVIKQSLIRIFGIKEICFSAEGINLLGSDSDDLMTCTKGVLTFLSAGLRHNAMEFSPLGIVRSNNDAYKVYVKQIDRGGIVPIAYLFQDGFNLDALDVFIIAKTCSDAEILYKNYKGINISQMSRLESIKKDGASVIKLSEDCTDRLKEFLGGLRAFLCKSNYIYTIPVHGQRDKNKSEKAWILSFTSDDVLTYFDIRIVVNTITRIANALKDVLSTNNILLANTKSAIGSIMSRNGSHNIGSHVLAALSHNVGTMPDDRVLYQYIQQRMDYIATATTERPLWRQPVMFVAGVMRQFLIQRHLLDHISGSEGLHAYQFQNRAVLPDQKETIRIHVRRIDVPGDGLNKAWGADGFLRKNSPVINFVFYPEDDKPSAAELERIFRECDLSVAVPGGIVGTHAFYTIIENVVRNAAKHDWSRLGKNEQKEKNLDVYIDFRDNSEKGIVECRIWSDRACSDKENGHGDIEETLKSMERKIKTSFIEEDGRLRKETWGIAEMRISAGYLKLADIADIGGIGSKPDDDSLNNKALSIIRPVLVENRDGCKCLGYRFDMYKPRELLIVVPDGIEVPQKAQQNSKQYGIWFLSEAAAQKEKALPYSYVLFDSFSCCESAQGGYKLPFRVLAKHRLDIGDDELTLAKILSERLVAEYSGDFYLNLSEHLDRLSDNHSAEQVCYKLLKDIYSCWLKHLTEQRRLNADERQSIALQPPTLVIDVDRDSGSGKKSLVTQSDLIRFVFEHSFNSAAREFKKFYNASGEKEFWSTLNAIVEMSPRKVWTRDELYSMAKGSGKEISFPVDDMVRMQLLIWCNELNQGKAILQSFAKSGLFKRFVEYIRGPILEQANAFLSKYEETYVTLPEYFSSDMQDQSSSDGTAEATVQSSASDNMADEEYSGDGYKIILTSNEDTRDDHILGCSFCYLRHREEKRECIGNGYLEALSGAQSGMNAMLLFVDDVRRIKEMEENGSQTVDIRLKNKMMRFATGLIENAMSRVLIIDERVKKFMNDHDEVRNMLNGLGIAVLDHKDDIAIKMLSGDESLLSEILGRNVESSNSNSLKENHKTGPEHNYVPKVKDFEIVVVHQGVIDKLLKGHEDKDKVRALLKSLIAKMRYVVITTGRGTPANIPEEARVLPYSVIENTLLKRYPEKRILVDTIMNVLPVGKKV